MGYRRSQRPLRHIAPGRTARGVHQAKPTSRFGHIEILLARGQFALDGVTHELIGANRHDVTRLRDLVEGIPPVAGKPGHPKQRPHELDADRAYDSEPHRDELHSRGLELKLARRHTQHGSGMGMFRWVAERTIAWLQNFRHLRVRFDRREDIHHALLKLAESLICFGKLKPTFVRASLTLTDSRCEVTAAESRGGN